VLARRQRRRAHGVLEVLGQVVPQVPPVGDLHRTRRADSGALGVSSSPVPADHLHPRMGLEPVGERAGLAVGEHIDRPVGGHIDQHGSVDPAAAQREVIHPQHRHHPDRRLRQRPHETQQAVPPCGHTQPGRQPRTGPPRQRQADRLEHPPQQPDAPRIPFGQLRDLLGERALRTHRVVAEEPTHPQPQLHPLPGDRGVGQRPRIPAVHPPRHPPATATRAPARLDPRAQAQPVTIAVHALDNNIRQMRRTRSRSHSVFIASSSSTTRTTRRHRLSRRVRQSPRSAQGCSSKVLNSGAGEDRSRRGPGKPQVVSKLWFSGSGGTGASIIRAAPVGQVWGTDRAGAPVPWMSMSAGRGPSSASLTGNCRNGPDRRVPVPHPGPRRVRNQTAGPGQGRGCRSA